jgi:HK97 family phage prohead protease
MEHFIWNDETVLNSYGFAVRNAGGRFSRFNNNPVMLLGHDSSKVIGRWENMRTEGAQLVATPVFDEADPEALAVKGKVERGFLRGCSLGIDILKWELAAMPDGSVVPVASEWEWCEASLCAVPSNGAAIRLYAGGQLMDEKAIRTKITELSLSHSNANKMDFKLTLEAYKALNLGETASGADVSAAITALAAKAAEADTLKTQLADRKKQEAEAVVTAALSAGKITADKKDAFMALAMADIDNARTVLEAMPARRELGNAIVTGGGTDTRSGVAAERESWDLTRWRKEDPAGLIELRKNSPDTYNAMLQGVDARLKSMGAI